MSIFIPIIFIINFTIFKFQNFKKVLLIFFQYLLSLDLTFEKLKQHSFFISFLKINFILIIFLKINLYAHIYFCIQYEVYEIN